MTTRVSLADRVAAHPPSRLALRFGDCTWTYGALASWVDAEVAALRALGVREGDRVAVLALNHPRTLALLLACSRLGAMLVPMNWRLAAAELDWMLDDAAPAVLFTDGAGPDVARDGTPVLPIDGPATGTAGRNPPPAPGEGGLLLVYTSGTTGRPKGAVLSEAALLANAALSRDMHGLTAGDHVLTVLPLFHVGGLNIQTLPALLEGAALTLHGRFDPAATLRAITEHRPTLTVLVPTTLQAVAAEPGWAEADLSSLRAITTGSTVVPPAATAPFTARGVSVLEVYGSTETAPVAIYTRLGAGAAGTGHPGPGCAAMAADEAGRPVRSGAPGEVWVRGPQLFHAYWRNPVATAEAFKNGWFRTGDVGTQAPDGSWRIHDRKKNVIVSGGENIYPAEIERVLHELPAIAEAAVARAPDPHWGEVPEAFVVLRPGAHCDADAILAHVRAHLARFKTPRRVHFVPSLPRNAMGKVQHALLRPTP